MSDLQSTKAGPHHPTADVAPLATCSCLHLLQVTSADLQSTSWICSLLHEQSSGSPCYHFRCVPHTLLLMADWAEKDEKGGGRIEKRTGICQPLKCIYYTEQSNIELSGVTSWQVSAKQQQFRTVWQYFIHKGLFCYVVSLILVALVKNVC